MNTNKAILEEITTEKETEVLGEKNESLLQQLLDETVKAIEEAKPRRKTAIGITRKNKEESKTRRKMASASRKKNWSK